MAIKKKKENIADQIINGTYDSRKNLKDNLIERKPEKTQPKVNSMSNLNILATREPQVTKTNIWDNVKQRAMSITNQNMQRAGVTQINANNSLNMSLQDRANNSRINQQRTPFLINNLMNKKNNEEKQNNSSQNPLQMMQTMRLADISKGLPTSKDISDETLYDISNVKNRLERDRAVRGLVKSKKEQDKLRTKVNALVQEREASEEANIINNKLENKNIFGVGLEAGKRFGSSLGQGALNYGLDIAGTMQSLSSQSDDNFVNTAKQLGSKNSQVNAKIKNPIVSGAGRAGETIGFMIPSIVASAVAPESNLSGVVNAVGVGSSSYLENLDEEQTNKLESLLTGVAKGAVSYKIEQLSDGNFLSKGKSSLSKQQVKGLTNVSNNMVRWFKAKATEIGGEVAEENLENVAGYIIDYLINDKKITADELIQEAKQTSIDTFTTTALLNVLGLGGKTYRQSQQYETSRDLLFNTSLDNTSKNIILNDVLEGKRTSNDVFYLLNGHSDTELNNQIIDNSKIDENSKQAMKKVAEENELGINEIQYLIDNTLQGKYAQNQSTTIQNKEVLQNNQQVVQSDTKTAQNSNTEQTKPILQNYLKNASENGLDVQNKTVKSIYEVTQRRGIVAEYNEDIFKNEKGEVDTNKNAIWTIDENGNRKILINPNADTETTLQNIMVHELTHDFEGSKEYDVLSKLALDKMKTQEGYFEARKDLERIYSQVYDPNSKEFQTLVDQEAVANFLGENLGNQEFINELVNSQPRTTIQKIYDWVVDKIAKVTGNEKLFWKNVEQKFKNAYNSKNENSSQDSKYSIAGRKAMNNAIKQNPQYKVIENNYNKALQMASQNENNEKIRQATNWFQDKNGDWKFEFSDKDMDIKNRKYEENKIYKLSNVLNHDTLFLLYPELKKYNVQFKDTGKYGGKIIPNKKMIQLNINALKNKNGSLNIQGTLIHEIQHAIQDIEGFEGGTNSILSREAYYKSLGEIEATDTRKRYELEKRGVLDRNEIAPESSKESPKHKNYDTYIKNRNLIDKMKDSIYNYFNNKVNGGKSNDTTQLERENNKKDSKTLFQNKQNNNGKDGLRISKNSNKSSFSMQDNKYSYQSNGAWNDFLKKHSINKGTGETMQQVKLPQMPIEQFQKVLDTAQHIPQEEKEYLLETVKDIKRNKTSLEDFKNTVQIMEKAYDEQNENILDTKKTYNTGRREIYQKYMKAKTEYDTSSLENAKEIIHANKQGRRTKTQWLNIAKQIGTEIANKPNTEIEEIAYRTWQDERPSNKESLNRQGEKFVMFTSDEWINTIYDAVKEQREKYSISTDNNNELEDSTTKNNRSYIEENDSNLDEDLQVIRENSIENIIDGKSRKHYKTYSKSLSLSAKDRQQAQKLYYEEKYMPVGNVDTLTKANERIKRNGIDTEYASSVAKFNNNEKMTLEDVVTMERMIQMYSSQGDYKKVNNLMQNVAILGTELGQRVQALSIIKKMSPEGRLQMLRKLVDRTNQKENSNLKITDEQAERILKSNGEKELNDNVSKVVEEVAEDLKVTLGDEIRGWRYLSMLGNPRTHIRNLVGNVAMNGLQNIKNKVAGAGEDVASKFNPNLERTKTLRRANQDQRDFAKIDAFKMEDDIDGGGKYDMNNLLQNAKRSSNLKPLNSLEKFNSNLLDKEDKIFLRKAYEQAMRGYMVANNLSSKDMDNSKTLEKARKYATKQAQEATFHQYSALASHLNQLEKKGGAGGFLTSAVLPFKKTPINIAKTGVEYSPVGIFQAIGNTVKNITKDTNNYKSQLEKGKITQEQYNTAISEMVNSRIDQMAKGLTGTSIALIGYALAKNGIIKAGNGDDEDKFEEKLGNQTYSVKIGDQTFSLDWLAPSAIPLFVGANLSNLVNGSDEDSEGEEDTLSKFLNSSATSMAQAFEPMTEMSMLQGLSSAISSYEDDDTNKIFDLIASAGQSYAGQFVPTALGQVTKTIDPVVRDTTSTKKGMAKKIDQFVNQTKSKVPGLSQTLPAKVNVWGEDKKRPENVLVRFIENTILPYNREKIIEDTTSEKLKEVYETTGEKGALPGATQKQITINSQKYNLNNKEFNQSKRVYGKVAKKTLDKVIKAREFKNLDSDMKLKFIQDVYSYAKEEFKSEYAKNKNIEFEHKVSNSKKKYNSFKDFENNQIGLEDLIKTYYTEK